MVRAPRVPLCSETIPALEGVVKVNDQVGTASSWTESRQGSKFMANYRGQYNEPLRSNNDDGWAQAEDLPGAWARVGRPKAVV